MATKKQIEASKKNIKKAQEKWKSMTHRQHALVQPQGRARKKPGSIGEGNFFRITIRPKGEFVSYKNHDIGIKGDIFEAKPKKNVPEKNKPTTLMKKAQRENIKKAQNARWKK